jgi:uncharacterized heparinase superfamily protein
LLSAEGTELYDETGRSCSPAISTVSIEPGSSVSLFSGIRFPTNVLGDSIIPGRYRVVAVLQRDEGPQHVEAGTYNIPLCDNLGCRPVAAGGGASR